MRQIRKRGRPKGSKTRPPSVPVPAWVIECTAPGIDKVIHRCSGELSDQDIVERFGLRNSRWRVTIWPDRRPDQARTISTD